MGMRKLCVALAAIALGAVVAAPASAATEGNKIVEIRNVGHDLCVDLTPQGRVSPSLATCTGSAAQQFERVPAAMGGEFLRAVASGNCLDRLQQGMELYLLPCNAEAASQRVQVLPVATGAVKLRFQDRFAQVLYSDMGVLFLKDDGEENELWQIREVGVAPPRQEPARVVRLKNADRTDACVTENGVTAIMRPCAAAPGQSFRRVDLGDGRTGLRSTRSELCLANLRHSAVTLENCSATDAAQHWTFTVDELGNHKIANVSTARHLTPASDGEVATFPYWGISLSQQWQLVV
ncbi:RICIN domain-containing protein [Lentzea sp. NPDC054927]